MMLGGIRTCGSGERCRYKQNWLVIKTCCTLIGVSYFISLPSLHQFVTSSAHPEDHNVQPGLGLSETWYSWIVSVQSLGELVGAIAAGILLRWFYTKYLMLSALALCACGGTLFAIGRYGWMLLTGRFLIGVYQGAMMTLLRVYIGETSETIIASMPPEKREKSTLKYTTFAITFCVCTVSVLAGPGISAIVAQIPSIDQFRWPGHFTVLHAVVLAVITLLGFREKKEDLQRDGQAVTFRGFPIPFYTIGCLIGAFFVINWYFAVFETLLNPILGDNFGFDVEFNSYAFIVTLFFFASGTFVLIIVQRIHIDNRIICFISLLLALMGSLISTDWQSLGGDPCDQFSKHPSDYSDISSSGVNSTDDFDVSDWCALEPASFWCIAAQRNISLEQCEDDFSVNVNASCVCEAFSGRPYHCFWNPQSRVTGKECPRCTKLCRSKDRSLNFVQFLVGISLVSICIPLGRIALTLIASDAMGRGSQALIMGILVGVGSLARFTGPLWGNAAYLAANHRIYIVMNILTVCMLLVIVPYIFLYRTMKPAQQTQLRTSDDVAGIELNAATNGCEEHNIAFDTDDLATVRLKKYVSDDFSISHEQKTSMMSRENVESEGRSEGGGQREGILVKRMLKREDSEQVLLLSDMEPGAEDKLEECI